MTAVLGIDAAWGTKNPSGVALLVKEGKRWNCLAADPSYDRFCARANLPFDRQSLTLKPNLEAVFEAAKFLANPHQVSVIAADIPLATTKITRRRVADDQVSRAFGAYCCATHSSTRDRPEPMSTWVREQFQESGFILTTNANSKKPERSLIEVYPHAAIIRLLDLKKRLEYKVAKSRKYWPCASTGERMQRLFDNFCLIIGHLSRHIGSLDSQIIFPKVVRTLSSLKALEDTIDRVVCAWVGTRFLADLAEPYGDDTAAIWIPKEAQ